MKKSMRNLFIVLIVSMAIALFWNSVPLIKETVGFLLNPTAGFLLNWNVNYGMVIITAILSIFLTLVQKYTTDQSLLREIKKEQKILQAQMKEFKDHPDKLLELQKKQFSFIPKTFEITMRPLIYTSVPIILFFRWFHDYFTLVDVKIFGFFSWFWAYLILAILFSSIFRKVFNVA
jgi:uncharacterized membrane protein (DUF106 family)